MTEQTPRAPSPAARTLMVGIRGYQKVLSPVMGGSCRFYPSCSAYGYEAIEVHGAARGSWLAVKRIGRCQPFSEGGLDPVPDPSEARPRSSK
jgi:putative membrane protein insertion efficiency factor